ncbi:MAG: hypothetical protein ACRC9R_11750, partial [Enterovibrio sp.]
MHPTHPAGNTPPPTATTEAAATTATQAVTTQAGAVQTMVVTGAHNTRQQPAGAAGTGDGARIDNRVSVIQANPLYPDIVQALAQPQAAQAAAAQQADADPNENALIRFFLDNV